MKSIIRYLSVIFVLFLLPGCVILEEILIADDIGYGYATARASSLVLLKTTPGVRFELVKFADQYGNIEVQRNNRFGLRYQVPRGSSRHVYGNPSIGALFYHMEPGYYAIANIRNDQQGYYSAEAFPVSFTGQRFMPVWGAIYIPDKPLVYAGDIDVSIDYMGYIAVNFRFNRRAAESFIQSQQQLLPNYLNYGQMFQGNYSHEFITRY